MLNFQSFLAVAALSFGAVSASGQAPLSCTAQSAGTPSIRAEGVAELVGDIIIQCQGGTPTANGATLRQVNFQIFTQPSINITSRNLASGGTGQFSEAMLFIDDPAPDDQTLCGSTEYPYSVPPGATVNTVISGVCGSHAGSATGNGAGTYNPSTGANYVTVAYTGTVGPGCQTSSPTSQICPTTRGNAYQARQVSANSLIWQGIPFDPPGTLQTRVLRMTNIRVNATQLGVPAGSQAAVQVFISTSPSGVANPIAVPISNPSPSVALAQQSLGFTSSSTTCLQCQTPAAQLCDALTLKFSEPSSGFPSSFRRRNDARPATTEAPSTPVRQDTLGMTYQTESGFMKAAANGTRWPLTSQNGSSVAGTGPGTLGLADHGTRLVAKFSNIQSGISIYAQTSAQLTSNQSVANTATGHARLVQTDANGAGPFSGGLSKVSITDGAGQAVWEVLETDTTSYETMSAIVTVAYDPKTVMPALGSSTVTGSYAPLSTSSTANNSGALPRFITPMLPSTTFLTINSCRSNILFPFVSNSGGFDTGLAIANTSKDPFGTSLQAGSCAVNFYGVVGTSKVCLKYNSPSITGGEHFVWSLSTGGQVQATAGFQGYVIAQCNFQYAHGFAFISDIGAQKLAMGYLALVMDANIGSRTGSVSETLGN